MLVPSELCVECAKNAKNVKLAVETLVSRRERDEARMEMKRMQALKENNMEEYMNLVKEAKNGRLQFLLNETDNYLNTINRMIQEQRDAASDGTGGGATSANAAVEVEGKTAQKAQDYYRSTHRTVEEVIQPRMLKGGDLKEYQLAGLQWMVSLYNNNLNGILADEMGLGKTIQTIALLSYLMEFKNNNGPFLVVVPLSTLSNWVNEFNRWTPSINKVVYKGPKEQRKKIFTEEIESKMLNVLLTTYEYIMKDKNSLRKITWQYIIVDEGHRMKNAQSKFAQTLGTIYTSKHRILLTGTPLQNNLPELWALLNFLLPSIFSSVETFDQWFNKPFASFRTQAITSGAAAEDGATEENNLSQEERMLIIHRLHELLRPFVLRRVKDEVLDQMPTRVEKVVKCPLSAMQLRMYHSIVSKGLNSEGGLNNAIMQLKKVCNHPFLFLKDYYIDNEIVRSAGKFELLNRMLPKLKAAGHRVLLFSQMVEVMNVLEQFFTLRGFQFLRLDGNTTSDERERRMYAFNDANSPYFIFLLSTRAGGLGLNLATADTVIIFDSDWNPMVDAQAQARSHRIGQKNEVRVYRILTHSPIEERIHSRATSKKNLTELVVEAGKFNSRVSTSLEDNKEMMENLLNEYTSMDAEFAQKDFSDYNAYLEECDIPDNEELNEMMASYDGEFELYQQMDATSGATSSDTKKNLLQAHEIPHWMSTDSWHPKYTVLMEDVMNDRPDGKGAGKKAKKRAADAMESGGVDAFDFDNDEDSVQPVGPSGKAMRKRKEVQYNDGMTDLQYMRMIEKQQDEEMLGHKHIATPSGSAANSSGGGGGGGRGKRSITHLEPVLQALIKVISELQKAKRDGGGILYSLFLEKPSKAHFADYYEYVETPISLKEVMQKLKKAEYEYFEEVELDFALMSDNARTYNSELSDVFDLCEAMRSEFYKRSRPIMEEFNIVSITQTNSLARLGTPPPLPPAPGFDIFRGSKSFTGNLKSSEDVFTAPKAKRARTSNAGGNGGSAKGKSKLSLKLSLSSKKSTPQHSSANSLGQVNDFDDDDDDNDDANYEDNDDDEERDSGLVFSLSSRR